MSTLMDRAFDAANMSRRSSYYAGRGPTRSDCGEKELLAIYNYLRQDSQEKANAMAETVAQLTDLSASAVIETLYTLERRDYKTFEVVTPSVANAIVELAYEAEDPRDRDANALVGMGALFGRHSSPDQDQRQSKDIKRAFLSSLGLLGSELIKKHCPDAGREHFWSPYSFSRDGEIFSCGPSHER